MTVPRALYGNETWIVRKHETRIQTAEMERLHSVAGYERTDHGHSNEIRKKLIGFEP